jgi:hypothetical protein
MQGTCDRYASSQQKPRLLRYLLRKILMKEDDE